ncbi:MAG: hypothetical protein PWP04_1088 [Candidatus Atribacteria bacterium]|nr:hypothetical protein [Candidatus Atribacteria bacterium]
MQISHILIPTDFSKFSDLAIQNAAFLAQSFRAKITLVHVLTMAEVNALTSQPGNPWENVVDQIQKDMKEEFEANTKEFSGLESPALEVIVGEPPEELSRFAEENKVDLIVMGTHGRTGLAGIFLGSVTTGVIKRTCIPVMVVKCPTALKENE